MGSRGREVYLLFGILGSSGKGGLENLGRGRGKGFVLDLHCIWPR